MQEQQVPCALCGHHYNISEGLRILIQFVSRVKVYMKVNGVDGLIM